MTEVQSGFSQINLWKADDKRVLCIFSRSDRSLQFSFFTRLYFNFIIYTLPTSYAMGFIS